jgi:uncharacterized pyridoxamine 5'-phosphate oxidase family protein
MINQSLSQALYALLINGKMVNQQQYDPKNNQLEENPLYNELFTQLDDYRQLYRNIGYELVHKAHNFFFIRELNGDAANDVTLKIQALLIIIGRFVTEKGFLFEQLTDHRAGISPESIATISSEERYLDILHTCKLCSKLRTIEDEINTNLISRGLIFINSRGNYVLTESGNAFFVELTAAYTGSLDS